MYGTSLRCWGAKQAHWPARGRPEIAQSATVGDGLCCISANINRKVMRKEWVKVTCLITHIHTSLIWRKKTPLNIYLYNKEILVSKPPWHTFIHTCTWWIWLYLPDSELQRAQYLLCLQTLEMHVTALCKVPTDTRWSSAFSCIKWTSAVTARQDQANSSDHRVISV